MTGYLRTKRDAGDGVTDPFCRSPVPCSDTVLQGQSATEPASQVLGKRWLAVQDQHVLGACSLRGERVVLFLKPVKLGFEVANALLETAHLRDHAGIGTADVAE